MGEIVAIWIKRFKRGPMDRVLFAEAVSGRGLAGNANQGGKRQITIIDEARWKEACDEVGDRCLSSAAASNERHDRSTRSDHIELANDRHPFAILELDVLESNLVDGLRCIDRIGSVGFVVLHAQHLKHPLHRRQGSL